MADCNETLHELETYLDGELTETMVEQIRVHLSSCSDCLQAFEFHAELRVMIRRKCGSDPLPPGLAERLRQCLAPET